MYDPEHRGGEALIEKHSGANQQARTQGLERGPNHQEYGSDDSDAAERDQVASAQHAVVNLKHI